ncbi:MAG: hypothetical protein JW910_10655, partial [Anaerolineae bacterium]|nr:hypothetical protein [Anaerolineae bacterium]
MNVTQRLTPILLLTALLLAVSTVWIVAQAWLAPEGVPGEVYYAPFPLPVTLDGDLSDWADVPTVTLTEGLYVGPDAPAVTFAAAADGEFLYLMADVTDNNIITG